MVKSMVSSPPVNGKPDLPNFSAHLDLDVKGFF